MFLANEFGQTSGSHPFGQGLQGSGLGGGLQFEQIHDFMLSYETGLGTRVAGAFVRSEWLMGSFEVGGHG
jgi:hypothetical protein